MGQRSAILRILELRSTEFAEPLDLEHLSNCRKAEFPRFEHDYFFNISIAQLCHSSAAPADQKLACVTTGRIRASYVRIERIEPVHQSSLN